MIPQFPQFKKVEVSDRADVEAHTHRFEPYSDFNFTSLYAWDTNGERMISDLNGNLVVKFTDYSTHEPFLSFLGDNECEHTARTLIEYCKENNLPATLKLVPEVSIQGIRFSVLKVEEDRDNFDYIYSVAKIRALSGSEYANKRSKVKKFKNKNPEVRAEVIDLSDNGAQNDILAVIRKWEKNKIEGEKAYEIAHEESAIKRLFETATSHKLLVIGIFFGNDMLAFNIEELLPNGYSIGHFWKADHSHSGIYEYFTQEKAKHFETLGTEYMNYEQDLGLLPLRASKESLRPVRFLRKYTVSMNG